MRAQARLLPDGRRLHLQDGPIDLIIEAFGSRDDLRSAYRAAVRRFESVLDELCSELSLLRQPARWNSPSPKGSVAQCMMQAVLPLASDCFITPMAAVAGAVAEEILSTMISSARLDRAYVNNGGDIAVHLDAGQKFTIGMVERPDRPSLFGTAILDWTQPVRGIATSGWRGRSFSLGISDAVTVLAEHAAAADAAATIIANAVDLPRHPSITRVPANQLLPDNDLGERLVTRAVGELSGDEIASALEAGAAVAESMVSRGLIHSAALCLRGRTWVTESSSIGRLVHA
jgi:ApbE superfamily uncharacterized protein (UPF0280 family)